MGGRTYMGAGRTEKVYVRPPIISLSMKSWGLLLVVYIKYIKLLIFPKWENFMYFK